MHDIKYRRHVKKKLLRGVKNGKAGGGNNIETVLPRRIMEYSMAILH